MAIQIIVTIKVATLFAPYINQYSLPLWERARVRAEGSEIHPHRASLIEGEEFNIPPRPEILRFAHFVARHRLSPQVVTSVEPV
jgi:hypothetical protein